MSGYDDLVATVAAWEKREKEQLVAGLKQVSPKLASWALARFAEGFTAEAVRNALQVQQAHIKAGK